MDLPDGRKRRSRRNYIDIPLHIVWTTYQRKPLVTEDLEPIVYSVIQAEVQKMRCTTLALGGVADHVHLVTQLTATASLARLMQQVKGASSSVAREHLGESAYFRWADGYAAFALSRTHCEAAIRYVQRQKEHHADQALWEEWEETPF